MEETVKSNNYDGVKYVALFIVIILIIAIIAWCFRKDDCEDKDCKYTKKHKRSSSDKYSDSDSESESECSRD